VSVLGERLLVLCWGVVKDVCGVNLLKCERKLGFYEAFGLLDGCMWMLLMIE
jgi:hypothetical protein